MTTGFQYALLLGVVIGLAVGGCLGYAVRAAVGRKGRQVI